jgi:hypothetical protein
VIAPDPTIEIRRLNSPGPISDAFLRSRAFLSVIIGPVGSAKTVTALRKLRRIAQMQKGKPDNRGRLWRKARCGVIRETYPSIEKNTLPSWFRIHPETDGVFSKKAPFSHKLRLILGEDEFGQANDICDLEMEFRAIGDQGVEAACRGWEVNAVMIDEADLQPPDLLAFLSGRVGRFSDLDPSMVVDPSIILSLNAPYVDNWVYGMAVERNLGELLDPALSEALAGRPLIETFIQPGGREEGAENLHNLPGGRGYYHIQAGLNKHRPDYVARMIDNKFVPMQHGQPVYAGFRYDIHVAKQKIEWNPRRKLLIGIDQGLFAAGVFCQRTAMGQLRTLAECVVMREGGGTLQKIGPTAFGKMMRSKLFERFPDIRADQLRAVADPAAFAAADRADDEHQWLLAFQAAFGFKVHRAKTNKEALRLEAVRKAQAEVDGYLVDPDECKHLIRGHLGGYRYRKAEMTDGETRGHLEIADTIHTHVCDAEQYVALEGEHVINDILGRPRSTGRPVQIVSDYNELGG